MTTKVIIEIPQEQRTPIVVMEIYTGQTKQRNAIIVFPGQKREFTVHNHLNLSVMEVQE